MCNWRAWGVVVVLTGMAAPLSAQEVAVGLFSEDQAVRGRSIYRAECSQCHGGDLLGGAAPPLAGEGFLRSWGRSGRTLDDLFYIVRTTMPPGQARRLSDAQHLDVLTYVLQRNGMTAGEQELTTTSRLLTEVHLEQYLGAGDAIGAPPPEFIEGPDGLTPTATGPTQEQLSASARDPANWLYQTGGYAGQRFSPLDQITRDNVASLRPVCAYQMGEIANFQTHPIVHGGTMYLTTPHITVALDATTCRPMWRHEWEALDRDVWLNNRGVAVKDGRVVRGTSDGYLVALDAATGTLLWARHIALADLGETITMAPLIYEDLVIIGPAGSENAVRGWVGAFRLDDGTPVWRFNTVPAPGEPGSETWDYPPGIPVGGGAVWTPFTLDTARGVLHVAVTNPAPDFPAALRGGDNLYTNAMVALDVRTGRLVWYEQLVPADDHDWDLTQVGPLYRAAVGGTIRDLMATVGKDGILRVLDRESHERLFETPVTTILNADAPVTAAGTHACPGVLGGVEWNGPAYHPETNLLITPAVDWCGTFTLADTVRYIEGEVYLGGDYDFDEDWQGWLTAVDASNGSVRWRYRSEAPMIAAVTTTASGLVMTGELSGDFLVFDAATGEELFRYYTGGPIGGGLVTYAIDGRQYVAVMSGRPSPFWVDEHAGAPTAFIFALP